MKYKYERNTMLKERDLCCKYGIEYVNYNGSVILVNNKIRPLYYNKKRGYYYVNLKNQETNKFDTIAVHRVVYCWYNGIIHRDKVIDHIDNDKTNNNFMNLQEITYKENTYKDRDCDYRIEKCNLKKSKSFYQEKLNNVFKLYEEAKLIHDAKEAKRLRDLISKYKAQIRYWENNHKE